MTRFIILILAIITFHIAKAQDTNKRASNIRKFNIDTFNKYKKLNTNIYYLVDSTKVESDETPTGYYERLSKPGSPYRINNEYYRSLNLKVSVNTFYDIQYGKYYEYDENGVLIKEINEDLPYKFTVESLIHKMLNDFKVDLRIFKSGMYVTRYVNRDTRLPRYRVHYLISSSKYRTITLDGNTGKVLSDNIVGIVD